ncbi:NEQ335 [Nanoarchaeum equitans Kin4-M]|uniref:NEQ335 n=1 Tax=Nanoarchaeum equitans (strain Kin4-M) TaxID=228908 RepID=Q74NI6_NANEQ|nr:NEQ335 [Nanoarchaeum equitans Kin4-M]
MDIIQGYLHFIKVFLDLLLAPLKHLELLWVVIPIYVSWLLVETLHHFEKEDIIFNANSCFWMGMEWGRQSFSNLSKDPFYLLGLEAAITIIIYGFLILWLYFKRVEWLVYLLARSREIFFLQILVTPIIYYPKEYAFVLGHDLYSALVGLILVILGFFPMAHIMGEILKRIGIRLLRNVLL